MYFKLKNVNFGTLKIECMYNVHTYLEFGSLSKLKNLIFHFTQLCNFKLESKQS